MNMHTMIRTTNKITGERRFFIDGRRVCCERYELTEIGAARIECIYFTSSKTVERLHKIASGDKFAFLPF